jgi:beta-glucosidase/6-phospho-beta-glucosidase/beta-galactosidase
MLQVKWWCTVNEPINQAFGYEGTDYAPGLNSTGVGSYLAAHNMIKAHARAYHLYDKYYRSKQKGKPQSPETICFKVSLIIIPKLQ